MILLGVFCYLFAQKPQEILDSKRMFRYIKYIGCATLKGEILGAVKERIMRVLAQKERRERGMLLWKHAILKDNSGYWLSGWGGQMRLAGAMSPATKATIKISEHDARHLANYWGIKGSGSQ